MGLMFLLVGCADYDMAGANDAAYDTGWGREGSDATDDDGFGSEDEADD